MGTREAALSRPPLAHRQAEGVVDEQKEPWVCLYSCGSGVSDMAHILHRHLIVCWSMGMSFGRCAVAVCKHRPSQAATCMPRAERSACPGPSACSLKIGLGSCARVHANR